MKTSIKNLFAAALTVITLSTSAFAATDVTEKNVTVLNLVKNISKIVVNGNVELILVQAPTESVKIYDSYYSKNTLVQQENGVLRISSFQKEKLTIAVYVRNLSIIEANDNSTVKTYGKVSFLTLDVLLKDNATADINATTLNLYTSVKDNATLKLSGNSEEYNAFLSAKAKINMDQFSADCTSINTTSTIIAKVAAPKKQTLYNQPVAEDFPYISK
jgi:hypothetical protein